MKHFLDFAITYWTPIVATFSLFLSCYLAWFNIKQRFTNIKLNNYYSWTFDDKSLYLLLTITNGSALPISIVNAELNNIFVYRAEHLFQAKGDNNRDKPIYTSNFPINFKPHETGDILLEFVSPTKWQITDDFKIEFTTSKKKLSFTIKAKKALINFINPARIVSPKHK